MQKKVITQLFTEINVPDNHRGYPYLVYIVGLVMESSGFNALPLRSLYQKTAQRFKITPAQVENDIRSLLNAYFNVRNIVLFTQVIGYPVHERLSTKEFIFLVVDFISSRQLTAGMK